MGEEGANLQNEASRPTPSSALAADWALSGTAENQCAIPGKDRVDCGYPEVTAEQCNSRGCCFDSSIPQVPWCFKPLQKSGKPAPRAPGPLWACSGSSGCPWALGHGCPLVEASVRGFVSRAVSCQWLSPPVLLPSGLCEM